MVDSQVAKMLTLDVFVTDHPRLATCFAFLTLYSVCISSRVGPPHIINQIFMFTTSMDWRFADNQAMGSIGRPVDLDNSRFLKHYPISSIVSDIYGSCPMSSMTGSLSLPTTLSSSSWEIIILSGVVTAAMTQH